MSKIFLEFPRGANPHSYGESFSKSGLRLAKSIGKMQKRNEIKPETAKKIRTGTYSAILNICIIYVL